jgi:hypothetical protein
MGEERAKRSGSDQERGQWRCQRHRVHAPQAPVSFNREQAQCDRAHEEPKSRKNQQHIQEQYAAVSEEDIS